MPTGLRFLRLSKSFSIIRDEVWNFLYKKFLVSEGFPDRLFHYTGADGLAGIITTGTVWATDCRSTNDPRDGQYAWSLLDQLVRSAKGKKPPKPTSIPLRMLVQRLIETDDSRTSGSVSSHRLGLLYVASFSQEPDDLGQWRAYGADGRGFSVGVLVREVRLPKGVSWARVIYDEKLQTDVLAHIIDQLARRLPAFCKAHEIELEDGVSFAASAVEAIVVRLRPFFKHTAYKHEQEWRLVRGVGFFEESDPPMVRAIGPRLVSYVPLALKSEHDVIPLCRITLGPAQHDDGTRSAVETLLRRSEHVDHEPSNDPLPEIVASDLPYRSFRS